MQFLRLTHTTGVEIYINPLQVRAIQPQGSKGTKLVFDADHEINLRDEVAAVLDQLLHTMPAR